VGCQYQQVPKWFEMTHCDGFVAGLCHPVTNFSLYLLHCPHLHAVL
jgi:hypothetical protein